MEILRRLDSYREARRILVAPSSGLKQARINALNDGKELLVPSPGLKEGFYLFKPYEIPFAKLGQAISYSGLPKYGTRVAVEELCREPVTVLVTDCLAVDPLGYFVADGRGLFDLSTAILAESAALAEGAEAYALGDAAQLSGQDFESGEWDVRLNGFITSKGVFARNSLSQAAHRVIWDLLTKQRIRKITPLWKMRGNLAVVV